jgi:hypothetical protein
MNITDLDAESRAIFTEQIEENLVALGIADDYKAASQLYRSVIRTITRRHSDEEGPADKRNREFVIDELIIWDVRDGLDNSIEEAKIDEPISVYGLRGVVDEIAGILEGFFEGAEADVPDSCTREHLRGRVQSLKTQLNRSDTNKCTFRIHFTLEGVLYLVTAYISKGE